MQGAATTRTPGPRSCGSRASRSPAPAISHDRLSQTRTVSGARRGLAFLHDVEVVIEAGDLVDLGLRQPHLLRQRGEMRGREVAEAVLDLVQVLDQEVALTRLVAEERLHLRQRLGIDAAAPRRRALSLPRRRLAARSG